jgi:putative SOS response-associated peptidase YedK
MCGRNVSPDDDAIEREFNLVRAEWQFPASYNVAPTDDVPVVRVNKQGERTGSRMHWGLIPYWAKGIAPKFSTITRHHREADGGRLLARRFSDGRAVRTSVSSPGDGDSEARL